MNQLANDIQFSSIPKDHLGIYFLGQAGFLIKTASGLKIAVDPYLSDCCNRYHGFKRLMPFLVSPDELDLDLLVTSHGHYDHFDVDSVPILMQNGKTHLIGALDTKVECERLHITENVTYLAKGQSVTQLGVTIEAVNCDHGELAPDALGLLLHVDGKKIYYMGDTAYRQDYLDDERLHNVDLLLLPINGAFGNLDEREAAQVCRILNPKLAVPCHYWNFAQHGGNPMLYMDAMQKIAVDITYTCMRPGEKILI